MMEDALYQWDANTSAFVPYTGGSTSPFDACTIRAIAEQGMEAGFGAQVVAAARRFDGLAPAAGEADRPHRPEYVQVALGELGEALMKDGEACTAHVARAVKLLTGEVLP